ncbi:MAG: hypothetical protein AAGK17_01950 [Pseudomonadota bacterium]
MKTVITRKRLLLGLLALFLVLQMHSYWQFRYMLSAYFDQSGDASDSTGGVAYPLVEPFFYVLEVAAVRIYHQYRLTAGGYSSPKEGWEAMSADRVHKVVSDVYIESGNSNNVGDEYYGPSQIHTKSCSLNFYDIKSCDRRYIISYNRICSFPADIYISFDHIRCQQFFIHGDEVYSDFAGVKFYPFLKNQRVNIGQEQ